MEEAEPMKIECDFVLKACKDIKEGEIVGIVNFNQLPPVASWGDGFFEIVKYDDEDEGE